MVARRFAIVSLLTILFGLAFAQLVAEAGRERHWRIGSACTFDSGTGCLNP